ncbi:bifunctional hydroxymethylpyrimidine kinase/phosphomethylpyrimidine kinase [Paenibacillus agilis]|uniref:Hydroxymethylpyrimidine/phosphomethylpyrimidine kinase n=1 Tax=Paenibacillus agilis TaxID=3020863 RepID=A0A559J432_9BACL|nr:bifunctional hydroxymethylpyrimidine kinase/phosphomethylpyrimidine kinase [Paenibacillus agilis]TVX94645.1 bifunctional hydroxymethylpyrimidine kinase/phosphomethylpyrimidine kinase [Paenibacillus agilis]
MPARAATIAGSDSSGGAGIQADIKTFQECGAYGMSVITALTAQNTLGVHDVHRIPAAHIAAQFDALEDDVRPDAVKTGMLADGQTINIVSERLVTYRWPNIVVDPVMIAKGGTALLEKNAVEQLRTHLLPIATVVTPNIPEAAALTSIAIHSRIEQFEAAKRLHELGAGHVLVKGGHGPDKDYSTDLLYDGSEGWWIEGPRHDTIRTHGTGCTLSSAITAYLAKGYSVLDSIIKAKQYIHMAIKYPIAVGKGHGPVNHWAARTLNGRDGSLCHYIKS